VRRPGPAEWIEMVELLHRFTWAVDQSEHALLREVLSESVHWDASSVTGRPEMDFSPDELIDDLARAASRFDGLQHIVGNQLVTVADDGLSGEVRSYCYVTLAVDAAADPVKANAACYRITARRKEDSPSQRFLISEIVVTKVWDVPNPQLPPPRASDPTGPGADPY
jgi:SnoaL-like domain